MKHLIILVLLGLAIVALQGCRNWHTSHSHSFHQVHAQQDAQRESLQDPQKKRTTNQRIRLRLARLLVPERCCRMRPVC